MFGELATREMDFSEGDVFNPSPVVSRRALVFPDMDTGLLGESAEALEGEMMRLCTKNYDVMNGVDRTQATVKTLNFHSQNESGTSETIIINGGGMLEHEQGSCTLYLERSGSRDHGNGSETNGVSLISHPTVDSKDIPTQNGRENSEYRTSSHVSSLNVGLSVEEDVAPAEKRDWGKTCYSEDELDSVRRVKRNKSSLRLKMPPTDRYVSTTSTATNPSLDTSSLTTNPSQGSSRMTSSPVTRSQKMEAAEEFVISRADVCGTASVVPLEDMGETLKMLKEEMVSCPHLHCTLLSSSIHCECRIIWTCDVEIRL